MNYYNKIQKYLGKINYIGGAKSSNDIFADTPHVYRMMPREYKFKEGGFDYLKECIIDIRDNFLPPVTPDSFEIDTSGIKASDRIKFNIMINVLKTFEKRFDEIWNELYTLLLESSGLCYDVNYPYEPHDSTKYGLLILKSIYNEMKGIKKFKDGDDICIYGYSAHSQRQCRNFNGISQNELAYNLLHWPNKACPNDGDPEKQAVIQKDAKGRPLKADGTIAKSQKDYVYLQDTMKAGCELHRNNNCPYLHRITIIKVPGAPKSSTETCKQIDFQLIAHDPEHNVPPVVLFKGFQTLKSSGKWYRDEPFTNKLAPQCKFDVSDFVKINGDLDRIRSNLEIPDFTKDWKSKITKLNFNASNECISARVKIARIFSNTYDDLNEMHGHPVINNIDITNASLRAVGLTSFVYFRTIDILNLESTDAPAPEPVYVPAPAPVPKEEDAPEPKLTEDTAKEKIRKTLATIQRSIILYETEKDLLSVSEYITNEEKRLNKLAANVVTKISTDKKEQVRELIDLIKKELESLLQKVKEIDDDMPNILGGLERLKELVKINRTKLDNPTISKLELYAELFEPNSLILRAINNVPIYIEKLRKMRIQLQKFIIDTKKSIENHIMNIEVFNFK